jgi:ElaB/YqjD/DUF883 family membrane-anchored ribosome-binding protein
VEQARGVGVDLAYHANQVGQAMTNENPSARQIAGKELRDVLASTEALLAALGEGGGEAVDELRERLTNTISDVKKELGSSFFDNARNTISKARDTVTSVDDFVQERPWTSVAIGAGVGVLLGLILRGD